jgi:hypothetical protein
MASDMVYLCTGLFSSRKQVSAGDTSVPPDLIVSSASLSVEARQRCHE